MPPSQLDKYLYIRNTPTWLIRGIYILGVVTWVGVIYGYTKFFTLNPFFFGIIGIPVSFIIIYHLLSYYISLHYRQFDLIKHQALISTFNVTTLSKDKTSIPLVDIFIPICGEDSDVLAKTFAAVEKIYYRSDRIHVYVLDDKGIDEHRELALLHNFTYLSRRNKGHMKKAGNLKHGYEQSNGEFVVIFDADFAPHPHFLEELLPYMSDEKVAIIQSPQYFQTDNHVHTRSPLEYGASHVQEDFYRYIQVARSNLGAPICCGSNAIYRRAALDSIGGTVQIEHSEDAYTGFEVTNKGWKVKYIPIILAVGLCPADLHSYFHQQHRWCSGSLSLMLSKRFWKSNLNLRQKLCFISGFMYYLSHPVNILLSFQVFFVLYLYRDSMSLYNALPFIPCIIFSFFIVPMMRITKRKYGGLIARCTYIYSYSHASFVAFIKKSIGWQPTNAKRTNISRAYMEHFVFLAIYLLLYMLAIAFSFGIGSIDLQNMQSYSLLFWVGYNALVIAFALYHIWTIVRVGKKEALKRFGYFFWQMKTFGTYTLAIALGTSTSVFAGVSIIMHNQITKAHTYDSQRGQLVSTHINKIAPIAPVVEEKREVKKEYFANNLKALDESDDVRLLQKFLNTHGISLAEKGNGSKGEETTYYGHLTSLAVTAFQKKYGLEQTGVFSTTTRETANSIIEYEK